MTSSPATHAYVPPIDPSSLPLLNAANVAVFRAHHEVRTHADLHQAIATRDILAMAHNALLDPPFDPVDFCEALGGLDQAIATLDKVIAPTELALSDFFVEDWMFEVVDGEYRTRHSPLPESYWRERMEEAS